MWKKHEYEKYVYPKCANIHHIFTFAFHNIDKNTLIIIMNLRFKINIQKQKQKKDKKIKLLHYIHTKMCDINVIGFTSLLWSWLYNIWTSLGL